MDGIELKKAMDARKASAGERLAQREAKAREAQREVRMRMEHAKLGAAQMNTLKQLENPNVKSITQINNRPGELLGTNRTRGMKRRPRTSGISM